MKMYSNEWRADRLAKAIDLIHDMEDDEIGFSVEEIWEAVYQYLLDLYCPHNIANELAIKAFRKCGYTVEE